MYIFKSVRENANTSENLTENMTLTSFSKGDWGIEIWSIGLPPTRSKTLAKVECPFGCL